MLRIIYRQKNGMCCGFEETKRGGQRLMKWLAQSVLHGVR